MLNKNKIIDPYQKYCKNYMKSTQYPSFDEIKKSFELIKIGINFLKYKINTHPSVHLRKSQKIYYRDNPIAPGFTLSKVYNIMPLLKNNKDKRGLALDGQLKHEDTNLASSTM